MALALGLRGGTELEAKVASVLLIHDPHQVNPPRDSGILPTGTRVSG